MNRREGKPSPGPAALSRAHLSSSMAERAERQSRLLDQALLETFPASDPVSVALVA